MTYSNHNPLNSTPRRFPSYLLLTLLLHFLFIYYPLRCTLPDFPSVSSLASLQFLSCHRATFINFDSICFKHEKERVWLKYVWIYSNFRLWISTPLNILQNLTHWLVNKQFRLCETPCILYRVYRHRGKRMDLNVGLASEFKSLC